MKELSAKDRRALRAMGHHLKPVIQIGQQGITQALAQATREALETHELIKVKLLEGAPLDRKEAAPRLAEEADAALVQVLGRTILLYRPHPEKPKIVLGSPPKVALHRELGGGGDRPAAAKPRRAITQGAGDEGARAPAKGKGAKEASADSGQGAKGRRQGTGARLPPRRHR